MASDKEYRIVVILIGELGLGGSEHQLFQVLSQIDRERFQCHVIVLHPSQHFVYNAALEHMGIKVWTVPTTCRGILARMCFIFRVLWKLRADVVHSWSYYANPYSGVVGFLAGVPLRLGSLRGSLHLENNKEIPALLRYLAVHSVSKIVVNSRVLFDELTLQNYAPDRIVYLPNCIDIGTFNNNPSTSGVELSEYGIQATHRLVGIVGNLRPEKNHQMFVQGMISIVKGRPDVRGVIIGQPVPTHPEIAGKLQQIIAQAGVQDRIVILGFRKDIPALLRRLEVFCLTSVTESSPNAVLEAMATERPIVATKVGGIVELVEGGINGLLVEPGDVQGLVNAIDCLLANPEMASMMGKRGRQIIENRPDCHYVAESLAKLYNPS
jgi:glycosyltransferase involved in cell wall biosynthesis